MDDMNSFEQQLASELGQMAGPGRRIDGMAMVGTVSGQSSKGRFQSMFSATKMVVAGAIVALFGGFLVAGVLNQPSDEQLPVVGASASAKAEPSDALTTIPDLLPGVDLDAEQVAPGVYRVLGDGVRDIGADTTSLAVDAEGAVWLTKRRQTHGEETPAEKNDLYRVSVIRLGEPGDSFEQRKTRSLASLITDDARSVMLAPGNPGERGWSLQGDDWIDLRIEDLDWPNFELCARGFNGGRIAADGACWVFQYDGSGPYRLSAAGEHERFSTQPDDSPGKTWIGLEVEGALQHMIVDEDGIVWVAIGNQFDYGSSDRFWGFAAFDGQEWSYIPIDTVDDPFGGVPRSVWQSGMFTDPDGRVWVAFDTKDSRLLAGWDGHEWTTYVHDPGRSRIGSIHRLVDGRVLIDRKHVLDGSGLRAVRTLPPQLFDMREMVNSPDGSIWGLVDEPDGTALYVITPEAVEAPIEP